jgi:hypothetical protein
MKWDRLLETLGAENVNMERSPIIYFAGKIGRNDWRHNILSNHLLRYAIDASEGRDLFNPGFTLDCEIYTYGGPFFLSCDHGCYHGQNNHGAGVVNQGCGNGPFHSSYDVHQRRARVFKVNRARVLRADYVFAYLESSDCYGTLLELGIASAKKIPTVIGFAPELSQSNRDDLWMATQSVQRTYTGTATQCWGEFAADYLKQRR